MIKNKKMGVVYFDLQETLNPNPLEMVSSVVAGILVAGANVLNIRKTIQKALKVLSIKPPTPILFLLSVDMSCLTLIVMQN